MPCMRFLSNIDYNIEMQMGRGGQLCRSAGAYAQVMAKEKEYVLCDFQVVNFDTYTSRTATVGQVETWITATKYWKQVVLVG